MLRPVAASTRLHSMQLSATSRLLHAILLQSAEWTVIAEAAALWAVRSWTARQRLHSEHPLCCLSLSLSLPSLCAQTLYSCTIYTSALIHTHTRSIDQQWSLFTAMAAPPQLQSAELATLIPVRLPLTTSKQSGVVPLCSPLFCASRSLLTAVCCWLLSFAQLSSFYEHFQCSICLGEIVQCALLPCSHQFCDVRAPLDMGVTGVRQSCWEQCCQLWFHWGLTCAGLCVPLVAVLCTAPVVHSGVSQSQVSRCAIKRNCTLIAQNRARALHRSKRAVISIRFLTILGRSIRCFFPFCFWLPHSDTNVLCAWWTQTWAH